MGIKYVNKSNLVRFTKNEMEQLLNLGIGDKFYHVNLQHNNSNISDFENKIWFGVLIKEGGSYSEEKENLPILDYSKVIKLELINYETDILVKDISNRDNSNFLMENKNSLVDCLYDKYKNVLKVNRKEILNSKCYIREFVILIS